MPETHTLDTLSAVFETLERTESVRMAIGITDPRVAAYTRVLEYGSVAGQRPWPQPGVRTTRAVHPETGEEVIVSLQSPQGFIRGAAPEMLRALIAQLQVPGSWLDAPTVQRSLSDTLREVTRQSVEILRAAAPRDSGALAQSLQAIDAE